MDDRITLEMVRDRLRLYAAYLSTGGYEGKVLSPADVEACADSITQHLTQPAQAVDVVAIREVIEFMESRSLHGAVWESMALGKLTRAIGNAQAEG